MNVFPSSYQNKTRGREDLWNVRTALAALIIHSERFQYPEEIFKDLFSKSPSSAFAAVLVYDSVVGLSGNHG
ncbi:hypothetical protein Bealeia2_02093 (plasmid) [Candidatus Bealeia paramacronuclearis]|uniref:hypothetical protein n=1 Tax=Candidatus Bealeia paramacronuclearis TaxID=1921001 RepID=UPI002C012BD8|nr:hypothetical protein [Candidatus Bealeia paramacronuclearis]